MERTEGRSAHCSSSGLGKATVEMLLEEGAFVSILDLNESAQGWQKPDNVKFFKTDITKTEQIEQAVASTKEWSSKTGAAIGGVINCAGVATAAKVRLYLQIQISLL